MACLLAVLMTAPAFANTIIIVDQPLPNGDFANGLAEWTVEVSPDPAAPSGTVEVVGGAARIVKGGAFHAGLTQTFTAPAGLVALRFRLAELPQFASDGGFIPEAFDVHLTGAGGFSRAATFRADASAAANASAVPGSFNLGPGVTLNGATLRIPLDGVGAGEALTFTAALVGASSDTTTTVAVDDVVMEVERQVDPPPPPPAEPDRTDGCGLFRDGFEPVPGAATIPRCALGQIGDTGITACAAGPAGDCPADGFPGQDAEFGRDALAASGELDKLGAGPAGFDYTKLDPDGDPLPASAPAWACVLDNHTGLVWELKVDDPADPGHHAHRYSWFQPDPQLDGGAPGVADGGTCTGGACDLEGLVNAVNALRLCGATDWRVPTREELAGLVHAGRTDPALVSEYFPLGQDAYWTATPVAADSGSAWKVDFTTGAVSMEQKSVPLRVRLVRELR